MSATVKTPGVYINEFEHVGNAIHPVPTSIPAFIGYTPRALYKGKNTINKPIKVTSFQEFQEFFGEEPPQTQFTLLPSELSLNKEYDFAANGYAYALNSTTINYRLYSSIKYFYENGGEACYIMSIGNYDYTQSAIEDISGFINAIHLFRNEKVPTMLVIPDLVEIIDTTADPHSETYLKDKYALAYKLQSEMINHCGEMGDRIAILDIPEGYTNSVGGQHPVHTFRDCVKPFEEEYNSYAAAYYPWLNTAVYKESQVSYKNISPSAFPKIIEMLEEEFSEANSEMKKIISAFGPQPQRTLEKADKVLKNISHSYNQLMIAIEQKLNLLPPSAGIAGAYTTTDQTIGVWKAPANMALKNTNSPAVSIDNWAQEDLNVSMDGKSICAIRRFTGRGILIWGARTLDGNSTEWRYINVRRTYMFIEQTIKTALKAYVFEPNSSTTWMKVNRIINTFLYNLWEEGALIGTSAGEAFSVEIGLGKSMTSIDLVNGILRVNIQVALVRPGEYMTLSFTEKVMEMS